MRNRLLIGTVLCLISVLLVKCSYQKCIKTTMAISDQELIKKDEERISHLVKKRKEAIKQAKEISTSSTKELKKLKFSIEAYQLAIKLIAQLKNITKEPLDASKVERNRELFAKIRCLVDEWIESSSVIVSEAEGDKLSRLRRKFEEIFGDEGSLNEVELEALYEGREVYTGPREELEEPPLSEEEKKKVQEEEKKKQQEVDQTLKDLGLDESMSAPPPDLIKDEKKEKK